VFGDRPRVVAMFVELAARTHFSMLRGGSSPKALVGRAAQIGYDVLGVADCDGLYGMVRALEAAEELDIRLVVGCELAIDDAPIGALWLHVATHVGYRNLCRLLTESHARHPKNRSRRPRDGEARGRRAGIPIERVCELADGLWCLLPVEAAKSTASRASGDATDVANERLDIAIERLKEAFGERLSLAAWRHLDGDDGARIARIEKISRKLSVPVCATNRVLYSKPDDKPLFDVLHCIREGLTLDEAGRGLASNAEAHLKSVAQMNRLFSDRPAWLQRSSDIADSCRFSLRGLEYHFPCALDAHAPGFPGERESDTGPTPSEETSDEVLRRLTYEGALGRYPDGVPDGVRAQIERELALIERMQVAPYFLSVRSIVEMAKARDILCQGRGSAANSAVCYCLGVTAVDPIRGTLLFERFLSEERREPPDIDVDFEHERREEIIQAIYDHYTRDRAAMVSEVISYRGKSALRDVGKAFGLSFEQVERLSALVSWWDKLDEIPPNRIISCGFDPRDARICQVLNLARAIEGYPRHLSIHVGGFVLSAEPLVNVAPIEPATMPGRTVIPWDKDDLDTLGFFKVDVLGLGMLTAIRKALALAQTDRRIAAPTAIDQLAKIPAEDGCVYDALCAADTVGVFQIESRAQMAMLPRLRPRSFYDLVIEVAIVRPGPIQGGMVHPYLRRRSGEEEPNVPHAKLAPILERTLGVPLFQEQVMQLAIVGAGYTGGEADQLRRDMASWRRNGRLEKHRSRLLDGFERNGIPREFGERLYRSIEGFGEYGFPESHAASFALLVYASSWLKVHHPAAFAAALINSQPMGFYSPGTIVSDAERHGVEVLPSRVDASDWDCTLECRADVAGSPLALRLGMRIVKGLGEAAAKRIECARRVRSFDSIEDMVNRARIGRSDIEVLARSGALANFGLERREAMWKVRVPHERRLLAGVDLSDDMPEFSPMSTSAKLVLDYKATGVAVGNHVMNIVRPSLPAQFSTAHDLSLLPHGAQVSTAGLVICRQRPATASGVVFVTLEDETGFINLVLWSAAFERWRHVTTTSSMLSVHGTIEKQGAVVHVIVDRVEKLGVEVPPMSRDFH